MPMPATTGQLRSSVKDMEIGDYIQCSYYVTTNKYVAGHFYSFERNNNKGEIPLEGFPNVINSNGMFYLIKVDTGLLVSDRIVRNNISWDNLNSSKYIQGNPDSFSTDAPKESYIIRSLTGGVAYADDNGNKELTYQGFGAWPKNNEWDLYVAGFPQDKIQEGKTLEDVFHLSSVATWCQDTPVMGFYPGYSSTVSSSDRRIIRPYTPSTPVNNRSEDSSTYAVAGNTYENVGFRPVFEYRES